MNSPRRNRPLTDSQKAFLKRFKEKEKLPCGCCKGFEFVCTDHLILAARARAQGIKDEVAPAWMYWLSVLAYFMLGVVLGALFT